jgi:PAS domain S-box-containing protein
MNNKNLRRFIFTIVLPTIVAISLYVFIIFFFFIPTYEKDLINGKREMIRELTQTTLSICQKHYDDAKVDTSITEAEAQKRAIQEINKIRYGDENKDYFWIQTADNPPFMVMHPYNPELDSTDISSVEDSKGKLLFVEFVNAVSDDGEGYVDYMYQWKDDPYKIVPKMSFVKKFEPWNWIVGTGIYIEDVKEEIDVMEKNIILISLGILLVIFLIAGIIIYQSFKIDKKRSDAEKQLRESQEKYRKLVEASTEGSLLISEGGIIYSNVPAQNILEASAEELSNIHVLKLFKEIDPVTRDALLGKTNDTNYDTVLVSVKGREINVNITISHIKLGRKSAITVVFKDVSHYKNIESELSIKEETLSSLADHLNIGIFTATYGRHSKFIDANPACLEIINAASLKELKSINIFDLFLDGLEKKQMLKDLAIQKSLKNKIIKLKANDNKSKVVSLSAILVPDEQGNFSLCKGFIEDITRRKEAEEHQMELLADLQTSSSYLNQQIKHYAVEYDMVNISFPIFKAAKKMGKAKSKFLLVEGEDHTPIGYVTKADFYERVVAEKLNVDAPVSKIMNAPIHYIQDEALVFEAISLMNQKEINYLVAVNSNEEITGCLSKEIIQDIQFNTSSFIVDEIQSLDDVDEIKSTLKRLPFHIKNLIDGGVKIENVTRIITNVSDIVTDKLIHLAIEELGNPPVPFAFIALGSEGREEQTLLTDQDNAIIYQDVEKDKKNEVQTYFNKLGTLVCDWLNDVGYHFCLGNIMAKNPKWCKSLSEWKSNFELWIAKAKPQDLLEVNIFFDFRAVFGKTEYADELRNHINAVLKINPGFFIHMTNNTLLYKPPLSMFGNLVLKETDNRNTFNIKDALVLLVSFARVYTLKYEIEETNTIARLQRLHSKGKIHEDLFKDLIHAYNYLMQVRFRHQSYQISKNKMPDNEIVPAQLSSVEVGTLKKIFSQMGTARSKMSYDFKGTNQ